MATFQMFLQSGRAKDLSAPLYFLPLLFSRLLKNSFDTPYRKWAAIIVGLATRYVLEDLGFKPGGGRKFSYTSRQAVRSTLPPVKWVQHISL
jgi:hypothetical protein